MNRWNKFCLAALRIAIGWHFLYEGVYKVDSDRGAVSYATSRVHVQTSTAALRTAVEREPAAAMQSIDAWHDGIVRSFASYRSLSEDQKARLGALRDEVKLRALHADRGEIPAAEVAAFDGDFIFEEVLKVPPQPEEERFTSLSYLQTAHGPFRPLFRALVPDLDGLNRLTLPQARQSADDRAAAILQHYEKAGHPFSPAQRARLEQARLHCHAALQQILSEPGFQARLADYRAMRAARDGHPPVLTARYSHERLDADRKALDKIASDLLASVAEPLNELTMTAESIATVAQLGAGPVPRPPDVTRWIDFAIECSLIAIGLGLLLGIGTRWAAFAAAAQLAVFYLASPPWPGYPAASLGGHYLWIDRNFIELVAALAVATSSAAAWAGLDASISRWRLRRSPAPAEPQLSLAGH